MSACFVQSSSRGSHTELEVFLWNGQKLGDARHKILAVDEIPASEEMLANKKGQDVGEVGK